MRWRRGEVEVRAVGGGLWIRQRDYGLLLDAPVGVDRLLSESDRSALGTIALSGGRMASVGGLVPLLGALEPFRDKDIPLSLVAPLGDDRGARLAEAWSQGWPGRYAIRHDALAPGQGFDAGPFEVDTVEILRGEPRWRPTPEVLRVTAMAFRVHTAAGAIAFVPGAAPTGSARRAAQGAQLAVVEVGTEGWPIDERRWRMGLTEASALTADELWVVDERGQPPGSAES